MEWVAYPFPRGSSQPRNQTGVSCIAGEFFTSWATRKTQAQMRYSIKFLLLNEWCAVKTCLWKGYTEKVILEKSPSMFMERSIFTMNMCLLSEWVNEYMAKSEPRVKASTSQFNKYSLSASYVPRHGAWHGRYRNEYHTAFALEDLQVQSGDRQVNNQL